MATPISEEELQLKKRARRRLIGAIALVTVVAVFLPMVLDHEPKSVSQDISIQIPSQNAGTFTSKIVPVVPGGDGKAAPAAETPPVVAPVAEPAKAAAPAPKEAAPAVKEAAPAAAKTAVAEPKTKAKPQTDSEAAPAKEKAPEPKAKPKTKTVAPHDSEAAPAKEATSKPKAKQTAKTESSDSGSFVVQVAALTDIDKAKLMREQIVGAGIKAYTEVVPTAKGSVTRVRAGPFASREAAEKARDSLKKLGLAGNVVPK